MIIIIKIVIIIITQYYLFIYSFNDFFNTYCIKHKAKQTIYLKKIILGRTENKQRQPFPAGCGISQKLSQKVFFTCGSVQNVLSLYTNSSIL